jgi:hypothetical protein
VSMAAKTGSILAGEKGPAVRLPNGFQPGARNLTA